MIGNQNLLEKLNTKTLPRYNEFSRKMKTFGNLDARINNKKWKVYIPTAS